MAADPQKTSDERDAYERNALLRRLTPDDVASLQQLGQLLGDHFTMYGSGPHTRQLLAAARAKQIGLAGNLRRHGTDEYPGSERNPENVPIAREHLRAWLEHYGDDDDRRSAAAQWCGFGIVPTGGQS